MIFRSQTLADSIQPIQAIFILTQKLTKKAAVNKSHSFLIPFKPLKLLYKHDDYRPLFTAARCQ